MTDELNERRGLKPYFGMTQERYREWLKKMIEIDEPDCMFMAISPELYAEMKKDPVYGPLLEAEAAEIRIDPIQS